MGRAWGHWVGTAGLCAALAGCNLYASAGRNLLTNPIRYCQPLDDCLVALRAKHLAAEAWDRVRAEGGRHAFSDHYARGFREGFVDFYRYGGTGRPPALPPRDYWTIDYQDPEGHACIRDWFAGFGHGAAACREGGFRQEVVVPTALATPGAGEGGGP
jgi:hypothetical protein